LEQQEADLRNALPEGLDIEHARAVLRSTQVQFYESKPETGVVLSRQGTEMTAVSGDQLIFARFHTGVSDLVCSYDMEIDLLFDAAGHSKQRYINRLRLCP